ncbi:hypothetical protein ACA910_004215 [Epithemia clementina (nom. ined.)]
MTTIKSFCEAYKAQPFQECLNSLYADLGNRDPEFWAKELYQTLRHDPTNERVHSLNRDRKKCPILLYDLVDDWDKVIQMNGKDTDKADIASAWEQEIFDTFRVERLHRIIYVVLTMERAQALYYMQLPSCRLQGMHWYSKYHLRNTSQDDTAPITKTTTCDLDALNAALWDYLGFPSMNWRLFKLVHTERFGLLSNADLARWSQPTLAEKFDEFEPDLCNDCTANEDKPSGARSVQFPKQVGVLAEYNKDK